jgi:CheY-like chemotaxis protein/CHASE3 domain sensor protein
MRISIGQRIILGFSIALITLLVIGFTSLRNLVVLRDHDALVVHTVEVLHKSERLFNRLTDSGSLARGYALTGDAELLRTFDAIVSEVDVEFEALVALTADNVSQTERLRQLRPIIQQRHASARETVTLRTKNGPDSEARMARTVLGGAKIMDEIRRLIQDVQAEERRLLDEREASATKARRQTAATLIYGTLGAFLLVGFASVLITRSIRRPLNTLIEGATRIGTGDYAQRVRVSAQDEVGQLAAVFNDMAQQVELRQQSLAAQDWLSSNLAKFAGLFEVQRVQAKLCQAVLNELATVVNARHSVIYVPHPEQGAVKLQLQAGYACDNPPQELLPGQGLVGQVFRDQETLVLRDVPRDYIKINSALGDAKPAMLVVLPAIFDGKVRAVIELATFEPLQEEKLTFLRRLGESLGVVLNSLNAVARTEQLLAQAQIMTAKLQEQQQALNERNHELHTQSERLRQSEALLQEQQAELKQTNEELEMSNEELQQTNAEMEEKATLLEEQKQAVDLANREVNAARMALEDKVQQLALTSKYKTEFLANMSHELRTPLNSLLILSKVLAENAEANLTEKQMQRAKAIHSSGADLLELINDILDLSKIEAGSVDLDVNEMQIGELTKFVEATFRHMVEGKGLAFKVEVAANAPTRVFTDERRLQQILKNLLANACKFTSRGSVTLKIGAAKDGWRGANPALDAAAGVASFAVADTGIGIPEDRQQIIFEAFQQADAGTARKFGGTGLGLSISRELTRLLGGALTLKSQENVGSEFTLYLPVQRRDQAEAETPSYAPASAPHSRIAVARAAREREAAAPAQEESEVIDDRRELRPEDQSLLVIEDDKQFASILADFAHEKGFKVLLAGTAQAGIELARRYKPTAITLDLLLPDTDGWVVLDRLKHDPETRHIPLHVISVDEQRERSLRSGAVSFLQKPVTAESIQQALSHTIDFVNRSVKNLLVVEDDANQRHSILELIGNGDVHATAVGTAAEALQALQQEQFDCIVLDLGLPDMSGVELIGEIQKRHGERSPPIVIYTGKSLSRKEETALRKISEAIIVKDVSSPQRLLAETALFLHRVQSKLPESKRRLIEMLRKDDPMLSNRRVLVVDDDVRNIFAITAALENNKMEVLHAETGQAGIDLLKARPEVDVVLMDVMMPEMDGYEAIRRIRAEERFRKLPIIAVTAKAMKGDREKCLQAGASDYITKPVDMDQLRSLLRVWMYR